MDFEKQTEPFSWNFHFEFDLEFANCFDDGFDLKLSSLKNTGVQFIDLHELDFEQISRL